MFAIDHDRNAFGANGTDSSVRQGVNAVFRSFKPSTTFASAAVFVSAAAWGLFWIPVRYLDANGLSGPWALMLMNLPAAIFLIGVVMATYRRQAPYLWPAFLIGVATGAGLALYGLSLLHTSVIRATLLFYLTPIWATFIGLYWLGETTRWNRWAAIGLGLAGLFCLVTGQDDTAFNVGDTMALASGILWAVGASLIKRNGSIPVAGMSMFQYIFLVIFSALVGYAAAPVVTPALDIVWPLLPYLLLLSLCGILPAVFLIFWASQFLYPGRVGLLMMSEVLVAILSASILISEERLSAVQWLGAILIIGASVVELIPSRNRADRRIGPQDA